MDVRRQVDLSSVITKEGRANIASFDADSGKLSEITKGDQAVMNFRATQDGKKLVYSISTPTRITDLYVSDRNGANAKQLTRVNDAIFSKLISNRARRDLVHEF